MLSLLRVLHSRKLALFSSRLPAAEEEEEGKVFFPWIIYAGNILLHAFFSARRKHFLESFLGRVIINGNFRH